jgi:hypothetical protein
MFALSILRISILSLDTINKKGPQRNLGPCTKGI